LKEGGFRIVPRVLADGELETLTAVAARAGGRTRAGARHLLAEPFVGALARDERFLRIAAAAAGTPMIPFRATLFDKSRGANWLVVWHQDTALPLRARHERPGWGPWSRKGGVLYAHAPAQALERVVALRVHLDDSAADNGPLRVLPGSHRCGVLTDAAVAALRDEIAPVDCLVERGGVLVMRPLLVHASSKSASGRPRRVIHVEYAASLAIETGVELAVD
jgi:hypothetical protein